jgi:hypothetical protein
LYFAVIVKRFLGFRESVAARGLVAHKSLEGQMVAIVRIRGRGRFAIELGFDSGEGSSGALQKPFRLDELVEEMGFEIVFG